MGSGQSKQTQPAPSTAQTVQPQVKRNRQFQEVQIKEQGKPNTPRSRQQPPSQATSSGNNNKSAAARGVHGQDPGALGSTSEKKGHTGSTGTARQGGATSDKRNSTQTKSSTTSQQVSGIITPYENSYSTSSVHENGYHEKLNKNKNEYNNLKIVSNNRVSDTVKTDLLDPDQRHSEPKHGIPKNIPVTSSKVHENILKTDKDSSTYKATSLEANSNKNSVPAKINDSTQIVTTLQPKQRLIQEIVEEGEEEDDDLGGSIGKPDYDSNDEILSEVLENPGTISYRKHDDTQASGDKKKTTDEIEEQSSDAGDADTLQVKDDDIVFETFYHRSGQEFQCIYQSGMRFYLDNWGSKDWQPFPKRWYNEGLLVTNTILKDDGNANGNSGSEQAAGASGQQGQSSRTQKSDDREGFLLHPTKGRIPTYIFYKKHNVHMYFDKEMGSWIRMPIGWELHHDMVKKLVDQVEEAVPTWQNRHDMLALLRACNYDVEECITIYLHLKNDDWMKGPKTTKESKVFEEKEIHIQELDKKVRHLEAELQKEKTKREEAERNLEEQTNKLSEIEMENKQTEAQLSAVTGGRPKTARPISRMITAGAGKVGKGVKRVPMGKAVNPDDILDLNGNAMELRKSHSKLKAEVERYLGDLKHIMQQVGPAMKQLKQSEKGTQNEIEEVRALYRKEALQRKLLYNQLQEIRGNIRVFCRVRKDDRGQECVKFPSDQDIVVTHPQQGKKIFSFDHVFDPSCTQEQVFEDTKPIITSCADGYNVCLLAYGQTGSGKTFTMMGPDSNPGINIRAMKELFQVCSERKETMDYTLTVSLLEIYNETIQDLLSSDTKSLELRTAGNKVSIPGLIEYPIKNVDDVKKVMALGDSNRTTASTKMNSTSSRSHLVLMLVVEGRDKVTSAISRGTLVLCDLAGSERISKTEAEGQRLVEAAAINKSLSALGQVFSSLSTSQLHVPYRNSKLTQILQPSLGGDAKACLFVNISPDVSNFSETVSTLTFGSNARQVALGQAKQNISKGQG